jgi:hypothetical protein
MLTVNESGLQSSVTAHQLELLLVAEMVLTASAETEEAHARVMEELLSGCEKAILG